MADQGPNGGYPFSQTTGKGIKRTETLFGLNRLFNHSYCMEVSYWERSAAITRGLIRVQSPRLPLEDSEWNYKDYD